MKKSFFAIVCAAAVCACTNPGSLKVYQTDPLQKVLYTETEFTDLADTVRVARGENAEFQFVLTSDETVSGLKAAAVCKGLPAAKVGWVHDVHNENPTHNADDMIVTPDNNYPDPILDDAEEDIDAGAHKTIWVDVPAPHGTKAGVYKCTLKVSGSTAEGDLEIKKNFFVQVYPVDLPEEQTLKVVNWYNPWAFHKIGDNKGYDKNSQLHLDCLSKVAKIGAEYGQNCWLVYESPDLVLNADSTDFDLDFTPFDNAMEVLIRDGNLKYLCNQHIGGRASGAKWQDPHVFNISYVEDKQIKHKSVTPDDPAYKEYIQKYYPKFAAHLKEKGWFDFCYQHIADEPDLTGTPSQKSWSEAAAILKEAVPGMRTIDASSEIVENQDVSVVILGENIATMPPVPEGSERWMYTCTGPQGNYANRFIQQPLIKTRLLHWINFKYNECGYLHWGFTYWDFSDDPLHDVTPKGVSWPGGDCYLIYPGDGKVYPSIRICAMRDGIRDYDLLKLAEAKDPEKAKAWVDSVIYGPDSYNQDPAHLYNVRREILEFLSE